VKENGLVLQPRSPTVYYEHLVINSAKILRALPLTKILSWYSHNLELYLLILLPTQLPLIRPVSVQVVHPLTLVTTPLTCLLLLPYSFLSLVDYVSVHPRWDFLSACMSYALSFPDPQHGTENEAMID